VVIGGRIGVWVVDGSRRVVVGSGRLKMRKRKKVGKRTSGKKDGSARNCEHR
jgi:hypothetical protein